MAKFRTGQMKLLAAIPSFLFMVLVFSLQPNDINAAPTLDETSSLKEIGKFLEKSPEVISRLSDFWEIFCVFSSYLKQSVGSGEIYGTQVRKIDAAAIEWINKFVKDSGKSNTGCKAENVEFDEDNYKVSFDLGNEKVNVNVNNPPKIGDSVGLLPKTEYNTIFPTSDGHDYLMRLGKVLHAEYVEVFVNPLTAPLALIINERVYVEISSASNIKLFTDTNDSDVLVEQRKVTVAIKTLENDGQEGGELLCELTVEMGDRITLESLSVEEENRLEEFRAKFWDRITKEWKISDVLVDGEGALQHLPIESHFVDNDLKLTLTTTYKGITKYMGDEDTDGSKKLTVTSEIDKDGVEICRVVHSCHVG
eukprot:GHVS01066728.1.p1 GENE.GHVS01066728.1~~GHVS01066728.1.p1  ORF type:complete len:372 (+),score=39.97 GHVS01066728.1:22-1116(+)